MNRFPAAIVTVLALLSSWVAQESFGVVHVPSPHSVTGGEEWFDSQAIGGHKLRILSNGRMLVESRMRLLNGAQRSIYISGYAFGDGGDWSRKSSLLIQKLCEKSEMDGVDVRLLLDSWGSKKARAFADGLRDCGVKVMFFNPANWGLSGMKYILHEKLMIVDGERFIIGGSGYSETYHSAHRESKKWYDMDLEVEGPTACRFQKLYGRTWADSVKHDIRARGGMRALMNFSRLYGSADIDSCEETAAVGGTSRILPIYNNPFYSSRRPLIETYVKAIRASREKIRLYAPYFAPHPDFIREIVAAVKRGVDVEVYTNTPRSSDEQDFVILGMYYTAQKIVKAGAKVMMWDNDATIHRKGGVFDGKWALFGSDNMDRRGQNLSSESVVMTDDADIVAQLSAEMEDDHRYLRVLTKREILEHFRGAASWKKITAAWLKDQL